MKEQADALSNKSILKALLLFVVAPACTILMTTNCGQFARNTTGPNGTTSASSNDDTHRPNNNPPPADDIHQIEDPALQALAQHFFPGTETEMATKRIWRLTPEQIENTLAQITSVTPGQMVGVMDTEPKMSGYDNFAQVLLLTGSNYERFEEALEPVIKNIVADFAKACPSSAPSTTVSACAIGKLRTLASFLFRDSSDSEAVNNLIQFAKNQIGLTNSEPLALHDTIKAALFDPNFLYRTEIPTNQSSGPFSAKQAADSLAFTLTNAPPDAELRTALNAGLLNDPANFLAQAKRLLSSDQSTKNLTQFVIEWLEIMSPFDLNQQPDIQAYNTPGLGNSLFTESKLFLESALSSPSANLSSVLTANYSFVNASNNKIYGIAKTFTSNFVRTELDPAQRIGILTQPSFLASHVGGGDFSIINRGKTYLEKIFCMDTPPVPRDVNIMINPTITGSARRRLSQHVSNPVCASCHNILDPLGYANENYSKSGSWQTTDSGETVDPSANLDFLEPGRSVANSIEMVRYVNSSEQVKQCVVRQMFRYLYGRMETASDDPLLRDSYFNFSKSSGDIRGLVLKLVGSQRFVLRQ